MDWRNESHQDSFEFKHMISHFRLEQQAAQMRPVQRLVKAVCWVTTNFLPESCSTLSIEKSQQASRLDGQLARLMAHRHARVYLVLAGLDP